MRQGTQKLHTNGYTYSSTCSCLQSDSSHVTFKKPVTEFRNTATPDTLGLSRNVFVKAELAPLDEPGRHCSMVCCATPQTEKPQSSQQAKTKPENAQNVKFR